MKKSYIVALALFFIHLASLPNAETLANSYTTSFPLTENPISEGGNWVTGQSAGGNLWGDVRSTPGKAFGVSEPTLYGDPTAILTGTWGTTQTVTIVANIPTPPSACCHEIEVRLLSKISPSNINGYEILISAATSQPYIQLIRWNGPNGDFTGIDSLTPATAVANGDVLVGTATVVGNTVTFSFKRNGTLQTFNTCHCTNPSDSGTLAVLTGNPGFGFYDNIDNNWANFGIGSFTATDGLSSSGPQLVVTPASLNFGPVATGTTVQASFTVTNAGVSTLSGTATVVNAGGPFAITNGSPFSVPVGGKTNLTVRFAPVTAGTFSNIVAFTSNGGTSSNVVTGTGAIRPVAQFSGSPTNGVGPLSVTFTDTSTGTITNRFWNFGDNQSTNTTATSVVHIYNAAGTNTVTLIAGGPVGVSTNIKPSLVTVVVYPPGDVNGTFTVRTGDSLLVNQVAGGLRATNSAVFVGAEFPNGDVNGDGVVSITDVALINEQAAGLRSYIVTKILPGARVNTVPTAVTIYGIGFPTNTVTGVTIGPPVNLALSNVVAISAEQIKAVVPAGGGLGTGTVNVTATPSNGVVSFGKFINQ
jgi:PKD repeat protein